MLLVCCCTGCRDWQVRPQCAADGSGRHCPGSDDHRAGCAAGRQAQEQGVNSSALRSSQSSTVGGFGCGCCNMSAGAAGWSLLQWAAGELQELGLWVGGDGTCVSTQHDCSSTWYCWLMPHCCVCGDASECVISGNSAACRLSTCTG